MDALPLPNFDPPAIVQKAATVKPALTVGYPLRGSWWTHPGGIHAHLKSGEHRGKWPDWWVDTLTTAQAEAAHSDDHEGKLKTEYIPRQATQVAATPVVSYTWPVQVCPSGNCPRR